MNTIHIPITAPVNGWHFTPGDWDGLLQPLGSSDIEGVDKAIADIIMGRIRRRHSPAGIRARLAGIPGIRPAFDDPGQNHGKYTLDQCSLL